MRELISRALWLLGEISTINCCIWSVFFANVIHVPLLFFALPVRILIHCMSDINQGTASVSSCCVPTRHRDWGLLIKLCTETLYKQVIHCFSTSIMVTPHTLYLLLVGAYITGALGTAGTAYEAYTIESAGFVVNMTEKTTPFMCKQKWAQCLQNQKWHWRMWDGQHNCKCNTKPQWHNGLCEVWGHSR